MICVIGILQMYMWTALTRWYETVLNAAWVQVRTGRLYHALHQRTSLALYLVFKDASVIVHLFWIIIFKWKCELFIMIMQSQSYNQRITPMYMYHNLMRPTSFWMPIRNCENMTKDGHLSVGIPYILFDQMIYMYNDSKYFLWTNWTKRYDFSLLNRNFSATSIYWTALN